MYRITIGPDDVGRRVSVRSRTHAGPGDPPLSDTLGVLRAWDDDVLRIERRDGTLVDVAAADLVAGKTLPPPPPRRPRR
ncbi:MAG: hypothetical protein ACRDU8_06755 [Egibacteraceae bacterium]